MRYTNPAIDKSIAESMSKILQEHVFPVGQQLSEAATVDTKQYSWGKLKTVSAGKSASVVLHPEHHAAIGKLKDGESHDFEDETRTKWKAERSGDNVHFTTPKISGKITAKYAHIAESVEEQLVEEETDLSEALLLKVMDKHRGRNHPDGDIHIKDAKKVGETPQGHHIIHGKYHFPGFGGGGGHSHRLFVVDKDHKKLMFSHHTNSEDEHKAAVKFAKNNHRGHWVHGPYGAPGTQWHHEGEKPILSSQKVRAKKVVKEEVEQLEEAFFNHRIAGSQGIIHPNSAKWHKEGEHVDFYDHGTGDKEHGKVTRNDGKNIHILHKGKVKKYTISDTYKGHGDVQEEVEQLVEEETDLSEAHTFEIHNPRFSSYQITNAKKVGTTGQGDHIYAGGYKSLHTGSTGAHKHRLFVISKDRTTVKAHHATNDEKVHKAAIAHAKAHKEGSFWSSDKPEKDWHSTNDAVKSVKKVVKEEAELSEGSLNARVWVKGGGYYTYQAGSESEARKAHEDSKNKHEQIVRIQMFDRPGKTKLQKEEVELDEGADNPHGIGRKVSVRDPRTGLRFSGKLHSVDTERQRATIKDEHEHVEFPLHLLPPQKPSKKSVKEELETVELDEAVRLTGEELHAYVSRVADEMSSLHDDMVKMVQRVKKQASGQTALLAAVNEAAEEVHDAIRKVRKALTSKG